MIYAHHNYDLRTVPVIFAHKKERFSRSIRMHQTEGENLPVTLGHSSAFFALYLTVLKIVGDQQINKFAIAMHSFGLIIAFQIGFIHFIGYLRGRLFLMLIPELPNLLLIRSYFVAQHGRQL